MTSALTSAFTSALTYPLTVPARRFYVDPAAGDDANPGTMAAPVATTGQALTLAAGVNGRVSILHLAGSTQTVSAAVEVTQDNVSFGRYGAGADPILDCSIELIGVAGDWTDTGSNIWTRAFTPAGGTPLTVAIDGGTRTLAQANQAAVNGAGKWYWAANVLSVYSTSNPASGGLTSIVADNDNVLEVSGDNFRISQMTLQGGQIGLKFINGATAPVMDSVDITLNSRYGIFVDTLSHDGTVINCNSTYNGLGPTQGAAQLAICSGTTGGDVHGWTIIGGNFSNAGEDGILVRSTSAQTALWVYGATMENNYENGADIKDGTVYFHNCTFDQTGAQATDVPVTCHVNSPVVYIYDSTILGRTASSTASYGVTIQEGAVVTLVRNFISVKDGAAVNHALASGVLTMEANTCLKVGTASVPQIVNIAANVTSVLTNNTLIGMTGTTIECLRLQNSAAVTSKNNIFYTTTTNTSRYCVNISTGTATFNGENDLYYKGETTKVINVNGTAKTSTEVVAGISVTGCTVATSLFGDPLFTDAGNDDFTPTSLSPAKGAGVTGTGVTLDQERVTYPTPPDIGSLVAA